MYLGDSMGVPSKGEKSLLWKSLSTWTGGTYFRSLRGSRNVGGMRRNKKIS